MLAGFEGGESDGGMQVVGQRDGDNVDVGALQECFVIGDQFVDTKLVGRLATALRRDFRDGDDLGRWMLLE